MWFRGQSLGDIRFVIVFPSSWVSILIVHYLVCLQKATDEELCKINSHLQGNSKQPLDKPEMWAFSCTYTWMCMSVSYTNTCCPQPLYQILCLWSTNCFSLSTHHLGFSTNSLSFQTFPSDSTASCSAAHLLTQHPPWPTSYPLYRKPATVWDTQNRWAAVPLDNNYAALFYLHLEPCSLHNIII